MLTHINLCVSGPAASLVKSASAPGLALSIDVIVLTETYGLLPVPPANSHRPIEISTRTVINLARPNHKIASEALFFISARHVNAGYPFARHLSERTR